MEYQDKIHYGRNGRTKCGVEKRSQNRYGTNFGYAISTDINQVTCQRCLSSIKKRKQI